jgi:hypothetical protein
MVRIVTVYSTEYQIADLTDMSYICWFRMSAALAALGCQVDIATNELPFLFARRSIPMAERLRRVPLRKVRWEEYDVVKTLYHQGFETLASYGGDRHTFIISKLGSVVAPEDREGILFYGRERGRLFETQRRIRDCSRYVSVLSTPARELWQECFGHSDNILVVPGAVDREIPPPGPNPYPPHEGWRCLFAGNFYGRRAQRQANRVLVDKFNRLGRLLRERGCRLYVLGPGNAAGLDKRDVSYLGSVPYSRSWDYLYHAHVGVLLSAGPFMHNNESTKIYHYLRVGLPVVSEAGFPNDHVLYESRLGSVVENGDLPQMARKITDAATTDWDREGARRFILEKHTWDARAAVYGRLFRDHFAESPK